MLERDKSTESQVSAVVISHNRAMEAKAAVESLLHQTVKPLEVIFIDNASNPPLVLKTESSGVLRQIRFNEFVGASIARNTAIGIAKGAYIAFIDDDCIATSSWLEEIQKGIDTKYEILGGPIEPKFMATPPEWWKSGTFFWGVGVGNAWSKEIWGGNMIFKKEVFEKIGLFNSKIGRQNGKLLGYEETELINKGIACCRTKFMPEAKVFHRVTSARMTIGYIIRWSYYWGKTEKAVHGFKPLDTTIEIVIAMIMNLNPYRIATKCNRIKRMAWMTQLFGRLF